MGGIPTGVGGGRLRGNIANGIRSRSFCVFIGQYRRSGREESVILL